MTLTLAFTLWTIAILALPIYLVWARRKMERDYKAAIDQEFDRQDAILAGAESTVQDLIKQTGSLNVTLDSHSWSAQPFVQGARAETCQKDWNALREAIRGRADHEEIERLWDRCERWI